MRSTSKLIVFPALAAVCACSSGTFSDRQEATVDQGALVGSGAFGSSEFTLQFTTEPEIVNPHEESRLIFKVFPPKARAQTQIKDFQIVHDEPYHVFVVSQDLEHFFHIHPERFDDGTFVQRLVLPEAGYYKVYSDFLPAGGSPQVIARPLVTDGFEGGFLSSIADVEPDSELTQSAGGMTVDLQLRPGTIVAGREVELVYQLTDRETGEAVIDLQPYLAAWGHTLILSEDMVEYIHAHPEEMVPMFVDRAAARGGPEITFRAFFPTAGDYRIWTQFKRRDELSTVSFNVRAHRLGALTGSR